MGGAFWVGGKKFRLKKFNMRFFLGVSEMASAKMASAIDVRIDDLGSILKFRIGLLFGENSAGFCQSVWFPGSILNFRIGSVSSIGGSIAATLFADTISDSQISVPYWNTRGVPAKCPCLSIFLEQTTRNPLGHRPVDLCFDTQLMSRGFFLSLCAFFLSSVPWSTKISHLNNS